MWLKGAFWLSECMGGFQSQMSAGPKWPLSENEAPPECMLDKRPIRAKYGLQVQLVEDERHLNFLVGYEPVTKSTRQAVVLRHIDGMANPEIAEVLGIGVEAVESLTARGKRALAAQLSAQRDALGFENE